MKTYTIRANRTAADVIANNDEMLETGYDLESARIASIEFQRTGEFCAVWIEEEAPKPEPRVTRSVGLEKCQVVALRRLGTGRVAIRGMPA